MEDTSQATNPLEPDEVVPPSEARKPPPRAAITAGESVVVSDPLQRYLGEIRQFQQLSQEEEFDIAVRYQKTADMEAAYQLVTANLRLVVRIAFDFKRSWLNLLDLIQEGNVGLLLAIRKFDPYRGIRLSSYAAWWIRAYIIKFLLDNWRMVRVGTTNARRKLLFNLRKEKEALAAQGIEPVPKLLAERLDVPEQDVIEVDRSLGAQDVSLETKTSPDSDRTLSDLLPSEEVPVDEQVAALQRHELLKRKLEEFEATLPERERTVLRERLLSEEPATLQQLGSRFNVTREGLRQVEKRLLKKLREYLEDDIQNLASFELADETDEVKPPPRSASRKQKRA